MPLIEQWTDQATGISHWRVITAQGVTSIFGASDLGRGGRPRRSGPDIPVAGRGERLPRTGNRVVYQYQAENGESVRDEVCEQNRAITARRYLRQIRYANYYPDPSGPAGGRQAAPEYAFEVVFDYGEYDLDVSAPDSDPYAPVRPWLERPDPFSAYGAGFEIRTFRLCRGMPTFHHFPAELGPRPCLVHATRFSYREDPGGSLLTSVTSTGYRRRDDGSYLTAPLPPLDLSYSLFDPPAVPRFRRLHVTGRPAVPGYLAKAAYLPGDLSGDGLPGFLLSTGDTAWYYPPEGDGAYGAPAPLPTMPGMADVASPRVSIEDLDGDGGLQLVVQAGAATGYFTRTRDSWSPFTPLRGSPTGYLAPRGELADLDGDGRSELLFVNRDQVIFYPSRGTAGFGAAQAAPRQPGFPSAADSSDVELVTFAGAFGDALAHRIRVSDGEVAVWPNLGHGRFAPRVLLRGARGCRGAWIPAGCTWLT